MRTRNRYLNYLNWILATGGVVIAMGLAVTLVGSLLPRDHTTQVAIQLGAPPDRVWEMVSDFAATPRWRPDVRSVQMQAPTDGRMRFVETTSQGPTPFEVVLQERPTRQVVRVVDDGLPYGGTWTWELEVAAGGTRLTLTEDGFIRNPVFRVISRFFLRPAEAAEAYLRALARGLAESSDPETLRQR